ncbi:hypothetical protein OUZ56_025311 [Daphnia magna]|uniref:Uncharacterized protein n=1 Tax=Daphnia magna TaxID=35525 RepID=A0ABQ9ZJH3_9CRUS|nr:hypothetical protein OUZ56_025311 [Daphnia magna]
MEFGLRHSQEKAAPKLQMSLVWLNPKHVNGFDFPRDKWRSFETENNAARTKSLFTSDNEGFG